MTSKKLLILAATAAIGVVGLTGASVALADGDVPGVPGFAGHMGQRHGQMRGGTFTTDGTDVGPYHDQMHAAAAAALGITVDELDARIAAGKTVAEIAQERGIDFETVRAAMQDARPATAGRGMMGGRFGTGPGTGAGTGECPYAD